MFGKPEYDYSYDRGIYNTNTVDMLYDVLALSYQPKI
jgi:hypothetical protein